MSMPFFLSRVPRAHAKKKKKTKDSQKSIQRSNKFGKNSQDRQSPLERSRERRRQRITRENPLNIRAGQRVPVDCPDRRGCG